MTRVYKSGNRWLMDTTTSVSSVMGYKGNREMPITIAPDRQHLELWFQLHPEDDPVFIERLYKELTSEETE